MVPNFLGHPVYPERGVRNSCNSWLLQNLRALRSTSRCMLMFYVQSPDGDTSGTKVIN